MAVDAADMVEATAQPAAEAAEAAAPPVESTAEQAAGAQAEDIWARVSELDPEELIRKNPRLQGKLGALAQQQAQRARQEAEADYQRQIAEQREAARIAEERATKRRLAQDDPDALAARIQAELAQQEYQEQQQRLLEVQRGEMSRALADRLDKFQAKPIFLEAWNEADAETRQKLSWTNYREIDDFFEAAAEIIADHRSNKKSAAKAEELANKRLEALQKERAVEGVKAEAADGRADLGLDGVSTGDHIFSESEIRANIGDAAWRKANISKINAQAQAGLIRPD